MKDTAGPIADSLDGIPHPGECKEVLGHDLQICEFIKTHMAGRGHHAYLVTGPRGIGKASLCMKLAAYLFRNAEIGSASGILHVPDENDTTAAMIASRSHPNLLHLSRPWDEKGKRFKTQLTVDEVRKTIPFFGTSRGIDGWRVAIVDTQTNKPN